MPVVRIPGGVERAAHLFHHKAGEASYHKEVNPKGFTEHFNAQIAESISEQFMKDFDARRILVEGTMAERAETQPMPDHVPIEAKSPRLVAIQLLKRFRDIQYRGAARKSMRKPPSVILASQALESALRVTA